MIKFVAMSVDMLKQKYHLSSRIALRINALMMKKIGLSEAIIEMINEIKVLEKFLLDKRLLVESPSINHEKFNIIISEYNSDDEFDSLSVNLFENPQGIKIVCLEDEISLENMNLDEKNVADDSKYPNSENFEFALSTTNQSELKALVEPEEVNAVFSKEEIAKLKVLILTSTHPDEKIEALRKMMLIELEPEIKGGILLQALQDDNSTVRSEAAKGLKILGLSESVTDAIMKISSGSKSEQLIVIESMKEFAKQARVGEQEVLFAVMLGTLRTSKDMILLRRILDTLIVLIPLLTAHSEPLLDLDRQLSRILLSYFKELNTEVYRIYKSISVLNLPEFKDAIIDRYKNLPINNPVRNFYLSLIGEFFIDDDELIQLCVSEMVEVAATGDELDASTARLSSSLRIYGEKAVPHIVEKLCKATDESKVSILIMLSRFSKGIDLSSDSINEIVRAYTEIYPASSISVRLTILESPFSTHEKISEFAGGKFAKVIIDDIHEHKLERNLEILLATLRKLKFKILDVLENAIENAKYIITRLKSAEVIGRIGEFIGDEISDYFKEHTEISRQEYDSKLPEFIDEKDRNKLLHALNKLVSCSNDDSFPDKSPVFISIGKLIYSTAPDREKTSELSEMLLDNLRSSYAYSIIEALSYLASAPQSTMNIQAEILMLFLLLLDQQYPENLSRKKMTPDGPVYEMSYETTAYTELIPRVLKGLKNLALAPASESSITERILDRLLLLWDDLAEYRIIWGSQNVVDLAKYLMNIGLSNRISQSRKLSIIDALMKRVSVLTVMEYIGN
ncbi:MAG: hypothetical protein K8S87_08025, partial [Planctomycetes bacterium]|nr:hypothetical protein [Planctomycetota bacterium]